MENYDLSNIIKLISELREKSQSYGALVSRAIVSSAMHEKIDDIENNLLTAIKEAVNGKQT